MKTIKFNERFISDDEGKLILDSLKNPIIGNSFYSKQVIDLLNEKFNFDSLVTPSCTDSLELIADLIDIVPGDEIIVPSYTFVSTVLPFIKKGAKIIFVDSLNDHPNIDLLIAKKYVTNKTKALIIVHYGGVSCNIEHLNYFKKKNILVIEDAAQCINAFNCTYNDNKIPLGRIGDFSTFSFHETKNLTCGEGGLLVINNSNYKERAEIIQEKGTDRSKFFRGEIDKYGWVDIGSSFLINDISCALLYSQLKNVDLITNKRLSLWNRYYNNLKDFPKIRVNQIPKYAIHNAHIFFILLNSLEERTSLINYLKENKIISLFHYQSLNKSSFIKKNDKTQYLITNENSDRYSDTLLRLPIHFNMNFSMVDMVCDKIINFYNK